MTVIAHIWRISEYDSFGDARRDGAVYSIELKNETGFESRPLRECLANIEAIAKTTADCIGGAEVQVVIETPDKKLLTVHDAIEYSFQFELGGI